MGLDGIELIMDVEESFDITIRDEDAERLRTAGDLLAYVQTALAARRAARTTGVPRAVRRRRHSTRCDGS